MSNLITNPNMGNWKHVRYFTDQEGKTGTIEAPESWEFVYVPRESDPNKIPQSLHRDNGFVMSAGYRAWESGYKQSAIQVSGGQRYRLKARIKADVNFPGGQAPDLTAITWRFTVESSAGKLEQDWAITSKAQTKQTEEFVYIFDIEEAMSLDVTFWGRSFYAGNDCDFWVYEISLDAIPKDGAIVDKLGTAKQSDIPATVNTTEKIAVSDVEEILNESSGKSLADVHLTSQEIDLIAAALRTLAVNSPDSGTSVGLNKLAEVFERLK